MALNTRAAYWNSIHVTFRVSKPKSFSLQKLYNPVHVCWVQNRMWQHWYYLPVFISKTDLRRCTTYFQCSETPKQLLVFSKFAEICMFHFCVERKCSLWEIVCFFKLFKNNTWVKFHKSVFCQISDNSAHWFSSRYSIRKAAICYRV